MSYLTEERERVTHAMNAVANGGCFPRIARFRRVERL